MEEQLRSAFAECRLQAADHLISQAVQVAQAHGLAAADLVQECEAFLLTTGHDTVETLSDHDWDTFQQQLSGRTRKRRRPLQESLDYSNTWEERSRRSSTTASPAASKMATPVKPPSAAGSAALPHSTPRTAVAASPAATPGSARLRPAEGSAFKTRKQSGQVVASLHEHLQPAVAAAFGATDAAEGQERCAVELEGPCVAPGQRYLVDTLQDKVNYIEGRLGAFAAALQQVTGCSPSHPVFAAAQDPVWMVGRICCDSEGRLNECSVQLEGSLELSQGQRVRLDLSRLTSYRVFPGQVVGVRGVSPSGMVVVASELITHLPRPLCAPSPVATDGVAGPRALSLVAAVGPFTTSEDAAYAPLQALLERCAGAPPDVLLLVGPFVDAEHPLVEAGQLQHTFQQVFDEQVLEPLQAFAAGPGRCTRVLLQPSTRDVHASPVFPQPALPDVPGGGVTMLPNPATVCCRGVRLACCATDVLRHLSGQEAHRGPQGDRLAGLAMDMLGQRSFYPLYPAVPGSFLDSSLASALDLPCTPDVLLTPSDLTPFAKVLGLALTQAHQGAAAPGMQQPPQASALVCANPGRLARGVSGGTFLQLTVCVPASGAASSVPERCMALIKKL